MLQSLASSIPKPRSEERGYRQRGGRKKKTFSTTAPSFTALMLSLPLPLHRSFTHPPNLFAGQHEGPAPILKKGRGKRKAERHVHASPYKEGGTPRGEYLRTGKVVWGEYCIRRERKRKEDKTQTFYNQTRSPTLPCLVLNFPTSRPQHL